MVTWQLTPYALVLIVSAFLSGALAFYAWRRRPAAGALALSFLMVAAALWSLTYAFQLGSPTLEGKLAWTKIQYLSVVSAPVVWLAIVFQYVQRNSWLKSLPFVALPSLATLILAWTNEHHHLIWPDMQLVSYQSMPVLVLEHGLGLALYAGYAYLLLLIGCFLLFREHWRASYLQRGQTGAMLAGILIPGLGSALYLLGLGPFPYLDLTPLGYTLTGVLIAQALFRYHFLDLLPIARSLVVESISDAVIVLDARARIVDLNPAAQQLIGQPIRELLGQTVTEALFKRFDRVERYLDAAEMHTQTVVGEGEQQRYYDLHTSPLYARPGELRGWVVVVHDVSAQKQAELALQAYQQQLETQNAELRKLGQAVEQSANVVIITNSQGQIEYVNPKFEEATGYLVAETLGQPLRMLWEEGGASLYQAMWNTITMGLEWRGEFRNRRKDGSLYWVRATVAPVYDAASQMTHFIVVEEDITERKMADAALYSFTERLQILRELDESILAARSPETIAVVAVYRMRHLIPCQRVLVMEKDETGMARLLAAESGGDMPVQVPIETYLPVFAEPALRAGRILGVTDLSVIPQRSAFQQALYDEGILSYVIVPLTVRETLVGALHLQSDRAAAFTADHVVIATEIAATLAVAIHQAQLYEVAQQEIAERKQAELTLQAYTAELEARNTELDAFAHTVAHDLKTPLTTVIGFSGLLADQGSQLPPKKVRECLLMIEKSAEKMTSIVNELLLLASMRKIDEVAVGPLDMAVIVTEVQNRLAGMVAEYGGTISGPAAWPLTVGYAPWIEEVWANYISNALKYGGAPPHVELGWDQVPTEAGTGNGNGSAGSQIRFWVHDDGPGLTEEEQGRLFTPFTRLYQGRTKGHGLGLSIVRRIIEKLGGQVGVESRVGQGSTFFFTLPVPHGSRPEQSELQPENRA